MMSRSYAVADPSTVIGRIFGRAWKALLSKNLLQNWSCFMQLNWRLGDGKRLESWPDPCRRPGAGDHRAQRRFRAQRGAERHDMRGPGLLGLIPTYHERLCRRRHNSNRVTVRTTVRPAGHRQNSRNMAAVVRITAIAIET